MTPFEHDALQIDRDLRDGLQVDEHRIRALLALRNDATAHQAVANLMARRAQQRR
jgi:hypothetical protein